MKKSATAENKAHFPEFLQILATPVENLGFAATPRDFLKKIPRKTTQTHEQDRQLMLSELPEKNSSPPKKNPLWEEERTQELAHSRRVLSEKLKELSSSQLPKP